MIIESIHVQNFRSINDEILTCDNLTALIGPNGSGKSAFLKALQIFYNSNAEYTEDDFYANNTDETINLTVTFKDLNTEEQNCFKKYIKDNKLVVKKILSWPRNNKSQLYYGLHLQNPDFDKFRSASGGDFRKEYKKLKEGDYPDLDTYTNKTDAEESLQKLENSNPDKCSLKQDEGQFFGFKEVGIGNLGRFTQFVYIPAVYDASEETLEGRGTIFTQIMDLVIRRVLSEKKEFQELETKTKTKYNKILQDESDSLVNLETDLSSILSIYVPNASVNLKWKEEESIKIPTPQAEMKLIEDDYSSSVERCGHGLQRAFIMTMLQYLSSVQSTQSENEDKKLSNLPNVIIGIEEPEIYQHPNRQRHLSKILLKLAEDGIKGVVEDMQMIYTTHSPLFVDLDRFENIRKLYKTEEDSKRPKVTKISLTNFNEIVAKVEKAENVKSGTYKPEAFKARIKAIMTPWMNEGFFADVIALVEGINDLAAITGTAAELGYDLESIGISVIPCMSKNNLHQPASIFSNLEIPIYGVWDSDYGKYKDKTAEKRNEINKNHRLLRLFNHNVEDWPDLVTENFACFKNNLNYTLRSEIGTTVYDKVINDCCDNLCMAKKDAEKRSQVIETLIKEAREKGQKSETVEKIVHNIIKMADK